MPAPAPGEETGGSPLSAALWLMWGGLGVGFLGFLATWTDSAFGLLHVLNQELFEMIGRWLMRAGFAVAGVGAAIHVLAP